MGFVDSDDFFLGPDDVIGVDEAWAVVRLMGTAEMDLCLTRAGVPLDTVWPVAAKVK